MNNLTTTSNGSTYVDGSTNRPNTPVYEWPGIGSFNSSTGLIRPVAGGISYDGAGAPPPVKVDLSGCDCESCLNMRTQPASVAEHAQRLENEPSEDMFAMAELHDNMEILLERTDELLDRAELTNARLRERQDDEPPSGEILPGGKVWSRATGNGPFVVMADTKYDARVRETNAVSAYPLEGVLVKTPRGKFLVMPKADLTTTRPRRQKTPLAVVLAAFCGGVVSGVVGAAIKLLLL